MAHEVHFFIMGIVFNTIHGQWLRILFPQYNETQIVAFYLHFL